MSPATRTAASRFASAHGHLPVLVVALACSTALVGLMGFFRGFVLDDAYITYRYARNLAVEHTLAWNPGADPVEGYTSFLWVLLNAAAIRAGLDPVVASKILGALSALAVTMLLPAMGRGAHWSWAFLITAGVAFSPDFALLSMQGMETSLTALLILLCAWLAMRHLDVEAPPAVWPLYTAVILAFLSRPDSAAFTGALLVCVAGGLVLKGRRTEIFRLVRGGAVAGGILAAYMAWRVEYFGYLLPNTFYVKSAAPADAGALSGSVYAWGFLSTVAAPYLVLMAASAATLKDRAVLHRLAPVLAGTAAFFIYLTTIQPIQGKAWRFAFPVFPALLLVALRLLSGARLPPRGACSAGARPSGGVWAPARAWPGAWVLPLAAFFVWWPAREADRALGLRAEKSQHDRVEAGRSLAGLSGVMLTSEAGALPYYSDWVAVDLLGLTSEEIAHHGLSLELLDELNPDLVVTLYDRHNVLRLGKEKATVLTGFMARRGYAAIAAIAKNEDYRHVYFARPDSPLFDEISRRLRGLKAVHHVPLEEGLLDPRLPAS